MPSDLAAGDNIGVINGRRLMPLPYTAAAAAHTEMRLNWAALP
jgi:hypothetical protein